MISTIDCPAYQIARIHALSLRVKPSPEMERVTQETITHVMVRTIPSLRYLRVADASWEVRLRLVLLWSVNDNDDNLENVDIGQWEPL